MPPIMALRHIKAVHPAASILHHMGVFVTLTIAGLLIAAIWLAPQRFGRAPAGCGCAGAIQRVDRDGAREGEA